MYTSMKNAILSMVLCLLIFAGMFAAALASFASSQLASIITAMLAVFAACGFAISLEKYCKCRAK